MLLNFMMENEYDTPASFLKKDLLLIDFDRNREGGVVGEAGGGKWMLDVKVSVQQPWAICKGT